MQVDKYAPTYLLFYEYEHYTIGKENFKYAIMGISYLACILFSL